MFTVKTKIIELDSGIRLTVAEHVALGAQCERILGYLLDGKWHSIDDIASATATKITSADAQVRNLRKAKHGAFTVVYERKGGVAHYRLELPLAI